MTSVLRRYSAGFGLLAMILTGCHHAAEQAFFNPVNATHLAELQRADGDVLYIDKVPNTVVMQVDPQPHETFFCSYRVHFQHSKAGNQQQQVADERYFEYDMIRDWKLVVKGDSIPPVFFQPAPGLNSNIKEGILVFELPAGSHADTMVYHDTYSDWGTQQILLTGL